MDILDEMTKEEIINWVRGRIAYMMHPPKKSELLFSRWQIKEKKMSGRRKENIARGESLNMSKRDEYAKKFNESNDPAERLSLAKKMEPYHRELNAYLDESKAIIAAQKRVDKLHDQIDIERRKEREPA